MSYDILIHSINKDVVHEIGVSNYSNVWESISMTIYTKKRGRATFYRRVYEQHNGPIPKDEYGRSYEIHHIDGDSNNNDPINLIAVSAEEHYKIHYDQGDFGACRLIAGKLKLTPSEFSDLAKKNAAKQIAEGKHPWQNSEMQRTKAQLQVAEGRHPWQGSEKTRELNLKRVAEGTHNWLGGDATRKQIANGTHSSQIMKTCEHCGKTLNSAMHSRWHGPKCKIRKEDE